MNVKLSHIVASWEKVLNVFHLREAVLQSKDWIELVSVKGLLPDCEFETPHGGIVWLEREARPRDFAQRDLHAMYSSVLGVARLQYTYLPRGSQPHLEPASRYFGVVVIISRVLQRGTQGRHTLHDAGITCKTQGA